MRLARMIHGIWRPTWPAAAQRPALRWRRRTRSPREPRHDLDVGGIAELIDRRHLANAIAAVHQDLRIAREGRGVARYRHDDRDAASGELARLRLGALARR